MLPNGDEEKPIVPKDMTFEELLESKLHEEQKQPTGSTEADPRAMQKKEFLRKHSKSRAQAALPNQPSKKFTYYSDNF